MINEPSTLSGVVATGTTFGDLIKQNGPLTVALSAPAEPPAAVAAVEAAAVEAAAVEAAAVEAAAVEAAAVEAAAVEAAAVEAAAVEAAAVEAAAVEAVDVMQVYNDRLEAQESEINRLSKQLETQRATIAELSAQREVLNALQEALRPVLQPLVQSAVLDELDAQMRELELYDIDYKIEKEVSKAMDDAMGPRDFDNAVKEVVENMSFSVEVSRY